MKILIIGAGEVGFNLARHLSQSKHEVVVIEADPLRCALLSDAMDVVSLNGSGADPVVLKEAGPEGVDLLIAVTDSDETNMMASLMASTYLPKHAVTMARIRNRKYLSDPEVQQRFRVDVVINPEELLSDKLLNLLTIPGARDILQFEKGEVQVIAYQARANGPLAGKTLHQIAKVRGDLEFVIGAIIRPPQAGQTRHKVIIPGGKDTIHEGDVVYFVIQRQVLESLSRWLRPEMEKPRSILIGGGGDLSIHIAETLSNAGYKTRLMIQKPEMAEKASLLLDKAIVLLADCSELDQLATLLDEGVDVYVAASKSEAVNVLTAMVARKLGTPRTIVVTQRFDFMKMIKNVHDGVVLNPFELAAAHVVRYLHQMKVLEVNMFAGEDAEALELVLPEDSPLVGTQIKDARFPKGTLVGLIVRDGQYIIPNGAVRIEHNDRILFFCRSASVSALERLVSPRFKWKK